MIVQRATINTDDYGGDELIWSDLFKTYCKFIEVSDGEKWRAAELQANLSARFVIRWSKVAASITPRDRIIFEGKLYDISNVKEIQRKVGFEITASARGDLL